MYNHDWKPSHNHLGLFAWKCDRCQAIKEADPQQDQPFLLAYAQTLDQQFIEALHTWQQAPKPQKKAHQGKVHALYWVTRISYLRAGIQDDIAQTGDLSKRFPCPPELQLIFSLLKPSLPSWNELAQPINEIPNGIANKFDTLSSTVRNFEGIEESSGEIPNGSVNKSSTLSSTVRNFEGIEESSGEIPNGSVNKSSTLSSTVRKKRANGCGSGGIIVKNVNKGKNVYVEYWFRYERQNKQKSLYIPKNKITKIIEMNQKKLPIKTIIKAIKTK